MNSSEAGLYWVIIMLASICFGCWQHSFLAGVFAMLVLSLFVTNKP